MNWPILRRYRGTALDRIAFPLGGIGTGTLSLGGRGDLRDFEVLNRPAKGFTPTAQGARASLVLRSRRVGESEPADVRLLEGAIAARHLSRDPDDPGLWLPGVARFAEAEFRAAYPLAQVALRDPACPLSATLQAFNPFIPADPETSGLPCAVLRVVLRNPGARAVDASVVATLPNFIGHELVPAATSAAPAPTRHAWTLRSTPRAHGVSATRDGGDPTAEAQGTLALAALDAPARAVSRRTSWDDRFWSVGVQDFFADLAADGRLDERTATKADAPSAASVCVSLRVPARGERAVTFLVAWHFPHRRGWSKRPGETAFAVVGNHYATRFVNAWAVVAHIAPRLRVLEAATLRFAEAFCASDHPDTIKEAALGNLPVLRSETSFRAGDGRFFGWEGCGHRQGNWAGTCNHVWLYDAATSQLFGSLARSIHETALLHAAGDDGLLPMRVPLPLDAPAWRAAAADGQCGQILRALREYRRHGDRAWLAPLWPRLRAALEFCWRPGGWDADRDGVMEGPQHHTMDVEYVGPNPQTASWYLAALRAGSELARAMDDAAFAAECDRLADAGRAWLDAHLFNGDFYPQQIRPLDSSAVPPPGLASLIPDGNELTRPDFQLGPACCIDQLAAQPFAHECGLGDLLDPAHARAALAATLRHNRRRPLGAHHNPRRTFAAPDESGVLLATWPRGGRPGKPFPYWSEVWTGCEHLFAAALLWAGRDREALGVIADTRARHAGHNRNPFDEPEAGSHYARSLAAWAAVPAWTRLRHDATRGMFAVGARRGNFFWATGDAWGTYRLGARDFTLTVLGGALRVATIAVEGRAPVALRARTLRAYAVGRQPSSRSAAELSTKLRSGSAPRTGTPGKKRRRNSSTGSAAHGSSDAAK